MTSLARVVPRTCSVLLGIACFAVFFHSCRDLGDNQIYTDADGVTAWGSANSLSIMNTGPESVFYFAVEEGTYAVIDWIQSCSVNRSFPSGTTTEVPYSQIVGYKKGCRVVLCWWHCSGTMIDRPGGIRTMVIQTP